MKKDIFVFSFVALYCVSCKEMEKKGASFFSSSVRGVAVVSLFFFDRSRWREKGGRDWCGRPSFFYLVDFRKIFGRMGSHAV